MALFTPPTLQSVKTAAGLRPEQLSAPFVSADLDVAIQDAIDRAVRMVSEKIRSAAKPYYWPFSDAQIAKAYPEYDLDQREELNQEQQQLATDIAQDLALSYIYEPAGQLQQAYQDKAIYYAQKAFGALGDVQKETGLLWSIAAIAMGQDGETTPGELGRPSSRNTRLKIVF